MNEEFSYENQFLVNALNALGVSKIVAFGDSHVLLFEECTEIEVNHVGASTAYNLLKNDSSTGGRQQVLNRVKRMDPKREAILLCFGEVDLRANLLRHCYKNNLSIEDCVFDLISRYLDFAAEITEKGFQVLVYGGYGAGSDRNAVGSEAERNYAASCFHKGLVEECKKKGIVYFSLHNYFFDSTSLRVDSRFLVDGFHLYSKGESLKEIQSFLFERISRAAKNISCDLREDAYGQVVLGNVGSESDVVQGCLDDEALVWGPRVDCLYSVVFNLNAFIQIHSIALVFAGKFDLDVNTLTLFFDGHAVSVDVVQEDQCRWRLNPSDSSCRWVVRYPMLKAESSVLLSLKGISFKEKSLV